MERKSYIPLFICSLTTWLVGVSIMPLLPIYAGELGASSSSTGNFLAFSFAMLAAGTMLAGPLSRRLRRRRALIALAGTAALPATWLMGRIDAVWQLTLLTSVVWFAAGIALTLQSILMGLLAARASRGRMFGLLASTTSLAGLVGGLFVGRMAESWGYQRLFALLALVWLVQIGAALLLPDAETPAEDKSSPATPQSGGFSRSFWQLLLANMLVSVAASVGMMGGSIMMDRRGISLTAITLLAAFQAGMGLLTNPAAGRLSDRLSRKGVLMVTYGSRAAGLLLLLVATSLAGFWVMALCFTLAAAKDAVSPALVTDMTGGGKLDSHMSAFTAGGWAGHVLGFALAGYALQFLGALVTFVMAALLPLAAVLVLTHVADGQPAGAQQKKMKRRKYATRH
jgi:YNFM family putative membrane transporter